MFHVLNNGLKHKISPVVCFIFVLLQPGCTTGLTKPAKKEPEPASLIYKSKSSVSIDTVQALPLRTVTGYYAVDREKIYITIGHLSEGGRPGRHVLGFEIFLVGGVQNGELIRSSIRNAYMGHVLHRVSHATMQVNKIRLTRNHDDKLVLSANLVSKKIYPEYRPYDQFVIDMNRIPLKKINSVTELKALKPGYEKILGRYFKVY